MKTTHEDRVGKPKFSLGRVVITANAQHTLDSGQVLSCLARHARGDWGQTHPEDHGANERALAAGERLFSVYDRTDDPKQCFWIITEADRSSTTVLLPEDY